MLQYFPHYVNADVVQPEILKFFNIFIFLREDNVFRGPEGIEWSTKGSFYMKKKNVVLGLKDEFKFSNVTGGAIHRYFMSCLHGIMFVQFKQKTSPSASTLNHHHDKKNIQYLKLNVTFNETGGNASYETRGERRCSDVDTTRCSQAAHVTLCTHDQLIASTSTASCFPSRPQRHCIDYKLTNWLSCCVVYKRASSVLKQNRLELPEWLFTFLCRHFSR